MFGLLLAALPKFQTLIWILLPFRGWPESNIVFRFRESSTCMEGTENTWMGNDNKQSYSHLWGTLPKSLGACEKVNKKHILLILLFVDCGNGATSSLERILTGHGKDMERTCDMKEKEVDAHVTKWNDKAANDYKLKTTPEGLENSSYYHYPLTNHVFGLLSKNAHARPTQGLI